MSLLEEGLRPRVQFSWAARVLKTTKNIKEAIGSCHSLRSQPRQLFLLLHALKVHFQSLVPPIGNWSDNPKYKTDRGESQCNTQIDMPIHKIPLRVSPKGRPKEASPEN